MSRGFNASYSNHIDTTIKLTNFSIKIPEIFNFSIGEGMPSPYNTI